MVLNKKGSMVDVPYITVAALFVSVSLLIGYYLMHTALPVFNQQVSSSSLANVSINKTLELTYTFDYVFLGIFVGLIIALIISSFLIDVNPIFLPASIFVLIVAVIISVPVSNTYQTMIASLSLESELPLTLFIMSSLPYFVAVIGAIAMITIYAGKRLLGGGGL